MTTVKLSAHGDRNSFRPGIETVCPADRKLNLAAGQGPQERDRVAILRSTDETVSESAWNAAYPWLWTEGMKVAGLLLRGERTRKTARTRWPAPSGN